MLSKRPANNNPFLVYFLAPYDPLFLDATLGGDIDESS